MRIVFTMIATVFILATTLNAAVVSSKLAGVIDRTILGEKLPIIVTLSEQVDLSPHRSAQRALRGQLKGVNPKERRLRVKQLKETRRQNRKALLADLQGKARKSQKKLLRFLRNRSARDIQPLWIINGIALNATPQTIRLLARMPQVASITIDAQLAAPEALPASIGTPEASLALTGIPELWGLGFDGQGLVVATMDSGVDIDHPDLASRWRGGTNSWFDPHGEHIVVPYDNSGHGTGTMGVMVGGNAGGTEIGVAPGAEWIAVKIFNDAGFASNSKIHAGFQWLLDPDNDPASDDAPDVVNNSWSYVQYSGECVDQSNPDPDLDVNFHPDIAVLRAAGIEVVFAAGNSGPGGIAGSSESPANYPEAFAVGSAGTPNSELEISSFSSRGPSACDGAVFPEVVAPGYNIKLADLSLGGSHPNPYRIDSGTSFAAPYVSGTIALLRQAFPGASLAELEQAVRQSATDLGGAGPDNDFGYGLIDGLTAYHYLAGDPISVALDEVASAAGTYAFTALAQPLSGTYEFEFWLYDPASGWAQVQSYSALATWSWTPPSMPGSYRIAVLARRPESTATVTGLITHVVEAPAVTAVSLTETAAAGGNFNFTASASGGSGAYEYEFWLYTPAAGWAQVQAYSAVASWSWLASAVPGDYWVAVNARSQGSTLSVTDAISHVVEAPAVTAVSLTAAASGGSVAYNALASGGSEPYEYEFWLYAPASGWSQVQSYSTVASWNWTPSPLPGSYRIAVNARSQGSTLSVTDLVTLIVEPLAATAVYLTESAASGGSFAYTATASGGSDPYEYEFWLYAPVSGWSRVQSYSTVASWNWTPPLPGSYRIAVNARSQGSMLSVTDLVTLVVEPLAAAAVNLTESAANGGSFAYNATASGGSDPYEYEFWLYAPASGWSRVQSYSTVASWNWTPPAAAGVYSIAVNARSQGSTVTVLDVVSHSIE